MTTPTSLEICFLSWRDTHHPEGGGSEGYVENLARSLVGQGHRVTVFCARWPGSPPTEQIQGVSFVRRGGRLSVYPRGLAFILGRQGRQFDVVVDVINGLPFAAGMVRRRGVVAVVHHVHFEQWRMIYPDWRGRLGWFIESRFVPWLYSRQTFITVSESTKRDLLELGVASDRVEIVRNGSTPLHSPASRSLTPRLCVLARLVPHKRVDHALRVLAHLAPENPELTLDVIGAGWWEGELRLVAAELGIIDRVMFHGHVSDHERDILLAESWVMLLPSLKEGWGNAIIEAASCGVPTIAYRSAGGVRESIVDGSTGALVSTMDEMAEATARLLADTSRREEFGRAAKKHAARFDWNESAREFATVIRRSTAR